jgi:hypothetical protein
MSSQISMKPSTKPLKGVTSGYGVFDTLSATSLELSSINIAGVLEDGVFQNVLIRDSEITNTVIGAQVPNVGYFTDLKAYQSVEFLSDNFDASVNWDASTSIFSINNATLSVNGCSFLGNLEICQNYIRATNYNGDINLTPKDKGTVFLNGPVYISTSNGNLYGELTQGGITYLAKNDLLFSSSMGSSTISTADNQLFVTKNGDIELRTESPSNMIIGSASSTQGSTIVNTNIYHNLNSGDVITISSAGSLNGVYTVGNLISDTSFKLLPNFTIGSVITGGSFSKVPNTNILLNSESFVKIPSDTELTFGVTNNSISGNTGNLLIRSYGDTVFTVPTSQSIMIPQYTPINFSNIYNTNGNYTTNGNNIYYDGTSINVNASNTITLSGPTTEIDSINTKIYDPILTIANYDTDSIDIKDKGIEYKYYDVSSGSMKLGWFGYKTSTSRFTFIPDATNTNEVISGTPGEFQIGNISATNITLETGGNFDLNCGNLLSVNTITGCSGTINLRATSNLNVTSGNRISLIAGGDIYVPNNIPVLFGTSGSKIIESTNGNISITGSKNITLLNQSGGSISIPTTSFLSFDGSSIGSQRISSDLLGNLTITTNKNLYLTTTSGNIIFNPNNNRSSTQSSLQFGLSSEILYGNTSGITILTSSSSGSFNGIASSNVNLSSSLGNIVMDAASGNIYLRTYVGDINLASTFGNIRLLPTTRLIFDTSGTSNSILYDSNNLVINGNGSNGVDIKDISNINLGASSNINITTGAFLHFANDFSRYGFGDTSGNLWFVNKQTGASIIISSSSMIINNGSGVLNVINNATNISSNTITITGTTTNLNTDTVKIKDPIVTLANESSYDNKDRGIEYNYLLTTTGSSKLGWFGWKNTTNRFTFYSDAINTNEVISGTIGNVEINSLYLQNGITFNTGGGLIDMSCGTISNLRTIVGCSGVVNIIGTSNVNISGNNLMLNAGNKVQIPYNIPLTFGSTDNSILTDSAGNMIITALGGSGTVVLNSNVQINGTTENIYSTVTNIQDPIFSLGGVTGPILNDNKDRGIEFKWSNNMESLTGFFGYKNNIGRFVFIQNGTNANEIYSGNYGDVQFGNGYFNNLDLANGTISNVNTISGGAINIIATDTSINLSNGNIMLPYTSNLVFGSTVSSIGVSSSTGTLTISSTQGINFITPTEGSGWIQMPNNTPLYFGSDHSNFIIRNTSNNLQITNSVGNIELTPNGIISIPSNTFLAFGSTSNSIMSNGQELLLNGYNGVSINTSTFTISGNVNILGTISAAVNQDFDINTYILPLGTSQILNISSIVNWSTIGNLKVTLTSNHNFVIGDEVVLRNTSSVPSSDDTYSITSITNSDEFIIVKNGGITTNGGAHGTVKSKLTTYQGKDVGIQVNYWTTSGNSSLTAGTLGYKTGFFGYKSSTERWTYYNNATITNNIVTGDLSDIEVNKVFTNKMSGFVLEGNVTTGTYGVVGTNFQIGGGTINNTPIGVNTAQTGRFTNLSNTVSASFSNVTLNSSLAYTFERYTLSSGGLQTRNPSINYVISLFSVSGPNYTSSSGTMPSSSASIPDGTFKILVCGSMGIGSTHTIYFGTNKLVTPNPINSSAQASRITFKRQGQSAQLVFDAQANNGQGAWILLSNGVYVS